MRIGDWGLGIGDWVKTVTIAFVRVAMAPVEIKFGNFASSKRLRPLHRYKRARVLCLYMRFWTTYTTNEKARAYRNAVSVVYVAISISL